MFTLTKIISLHCNNIGSCLHVTEWKELLFLQSCQNKIFMNCSTTQQTRRSDGHFTAVITYNKQLFCLFT